MHVYQMIASRLCSVEKQHFRLRWIACVRGSWEPKPSFIQEIGTFWSLDLTRLAFWSLDPLFWRGIIATKLWQGEKGHYHIGIFSFVLLPVFGTNYFGYFRIIVSVVTVPLEFTEVLSSWIYQYGPFHNLLPILLFLRLFFISVLDRCFLPLCFLPL